MSKDPRDGLKLRLGYEVAREIERTPIIALGVIDKATKAIVLCCINDFKTKL